MATSTAATISQRCSLHTTTTHKDPSTWSELIASKADNCDIDTRTYHTSNILREIPTRISLLPTAATANLPDDDDDRRQHKPFPSPSINLEESKHLSQSRPSTCNDIVSTNTLLAEIDAKMRQRWPLPLTIESNCVVTDETQYLTDSPPPAFSSLQHTTLEDEDAPSHPLFDKLDTFAISLQTNTQHLIDAMTKNSHALCTLTTMVDELCAKMTRLECAINALVSAPTPPCSAPASVLNPTAMADSKIPLPPAPALDRQKLPFPPHRHCNNLHRPTKASPWPPPLALLPNSAQKLKPQTRIKKVPAKPSIARGCPGMSRTKDNLRPP